MGKHSATTHTPLRRGSRSPQHRAYSPSARGPVPRMPWVRIIFAVIFIVIIAAVLIA